MKITQLAAAVVIATAGLAATACGSSSVTVHGTVTPSSSASSVFGPGMNATSYGMCSVTRPTPGTQVTVTDPSGKVIGTGTLGAWSHASISMSGTTIYPCNMSFTMRGVPSEPRYGFRIDGVPGVIWETHVDHVTLQVSSGS